MENSIILMILLQIVLIFLNAVFACAEIAVISMNENKLAKMANEGDKHAIRLARLTKEPARFLATIQVAITLSGFLGSAFAAENFSDVLVEGLLGLGVAVPEKTLNMFSVFFITVILSYVTLIFGELVPKQIAMRKTEAMALGMSGLISAIAKIFTPLVWLLTVSTNGVLRLIGIEPGAQEEQIGEEEIRMMVDAGSEKGTIDNEEKEFIQNVFEFDDLSADEIATHRTDIVMLDLQDSMETWQEIILHSRHTRYPVCDDSADKIVGILHAEEYFRIEDKTRERVLEQAVRLAYFVPDSVKADVLFRNMRNARQTMAVVLDEYGGMSGIVTLNDLVEQLVGELCDGAAGEEEESFIETVEDGIWKIHGSAPIDEVQKALGVPLPCEDYETFNGLIFDTLGAIPEDGSDLEMEASGLRIQVTEIKDHQVETAIVRLAVSA